VVALKKMKRRKEEHEEGVPLSVLREIKIGVLLQGNVNIINIRDIIFEEHDDWEDAKDGNKKLKDDSSSGRGSEDKEDERRRVRKGKGKEIYLVMDFIDHDLGRLLKEMRERKEVFSMSEIKSLLYQLLSSIAHMHALGIIHRYLHPRPGDSQSLYASILKAAHVLAGTSKPTTCSSATMAYSASPILASPESTT
jgi:serine/threonine protein kinase